MTVNNNRRWTVEQAHAWYNGQPWLVGCNFIPSTAINQLEMWQKDTFDPETIDRELGWAAELGLNSVRVYLHDLVWNENREAFKQRVDKFLQIASQHGISTLLTIFDDCWYDNACLGKQPDPVPGLHNSGWVQSPGRRVLADPSRWGVLKEYVLDMLTSFGSDPRIVMWDLYNEVGNNYLPSLSTQGWRKWPRLVNLWARRRLLPNSSIRLLKECFAWAWEVRPMQPLTSSIWRLDERELNAYLLETADIITFHHYRELDTLQALVSWLREAKRPLVCTEYMARTRGSRFETHLPFFCDERIGCYHWGLVSGKTQTIQSWQSPTGGAEPELWFHDILRSDGTPYRLEEADLFRRTTARQRVPSDQA